eukprot:CAMPEP_0183339436 /NCGR_PEP_ID=MMETSP0164_2-20130417/6360_1 /TAXON_ID=221442 /ORGANISM="Coccolithus pelagicus ssp braarudi, Strain PLY182g" /LENGTH=67 /DNA_ID=CAMNT_0025509425 /DNA_START=157 /DNA_END=363 /DNA_ORIENTATION=-
MATKHWAGSCRTVPAQIVKRGHYIVQGCARADERAGARVAACKCEYSQNIAGGVCVCYGQGTLAYPR